MTFLTAQPDEPYFYWQLEIQLFNLHKHGVSPMDIIVLIGYDPEQGLSEHFYKLSEAGGSSVFAYPDTRCSRRYVSSIRPHILAKYFEAFGQDQTIYLYLDADVIFREIPFPALPDAGPAMVYAPADYISVEAIISRYDEEIFIGMCRVMKVDPEVIRHDKDEGGVQYIFRQLPAGFWNKVEEDCERLYSLLRSVECAEMLVVEIGSQGRRLSWCSDLWAVWWNLHYFNIPRCSYKGLDFSWAHSPARKWNEHPILHYTGSLYKRNKELFDKTKYMDIYPFRDDFRAVEKQYCSYRVVELIRELNEAKDDKRISADDCIIYIYSDAGNEGETMQDLSLRYYRSILSAELVTVKEEDWPMMTEKIRCPFAIHIAAGLIIPLEQLAVAINILRKGEFNLAYPYVGPVLQVERSIRHKFILCPEERMLLENVGKMEASFRIVPEGKCVVTTTGSTEIASDRTCRIEGPLFNVYAYESGII